MDPSEPIRILKANSIRSLGSKIAYNYVDFRRRCDEYTENVRQQTQHMIENAHAEAKSIREQALREGHAAGRKEGLSQAEEQIQARAAQLSDQLANEKLKTTLPAMHAAAEALARERDCWLTEWETVAVRLSAAIARKVIRRELSIDPQIGREILVETLELATGNAQIKLKMNPDDIDLLGKHAEEVVCSLASCGEATLVPDESIVPGGCVIETQHGVIDARLDTQLERIVTELLPPERMKAEG